MLSIEPEELEELEELELELDSVVVDVELVIEIGMEVGKDMEMEMEMEKMVRVMMGRLRTAGCRSRGPRDGSAGWRGERRACGR